MFGISKNFKKETNVKNMYKDKIMFLVYKSFLPMGFQQN